MGLRFGNLESIGIQGIHQSMSILTCLSPVAKQNGSHGMKAKPPLLQLLQTGTVDFLCLSFSKIMDPSSVNEENP